MTVQDYITMFCTHKNTNFKERGSLVPVLVTVYLGGLLGSFNHGLRWLPLEGILYVSPYDYQQR